MAEYQPGVCNIGAEHRRARRWSGIASFAVAGVVVAAVAANLVPDAVRWAVVPFVFGGYVGVLQDYFRFCVAFGALARYDLAEIGGGRGSVEDRAAVRADRKRALTVLLAAVVATVPTAALLLGVLALL